MITYFLFANLYGIIFYLLYALFLKDRDAHRWSRFYLLAAALASLLLPLVRPALFPVPGLSPLLLPPVYHLSAVKLSAGELKAGTGLPVVFIMYAIISLLLLTRFALGWLRFKLFIGKQQSIMKDGLRVILHTGIGPGSFGRIVLFPEDRIDEVIFCHEKAHIRQGHFYDKIFFRLLQCFFFPVVPLYLMGRELETVHEFQADHSNTHNREAYLKLLLQQHFSVRQFDLLQTFFHHPLKRRIMMLQKTRHAGAFLRGSFFFAALAATSLIMILQSSCTARPPEPLKKGPQQQPEKIYSPPAVSQMPVFPGDLSLYLTSHISYPKGYKGPGGTMYVQFVVNTEGKVEQVKILKRNPFGAAFAQQITNMLENMPQWKPGEKDGKPVKVYYVIPLKLEPRQQG